MPNDSVYPIDYATHPADRKAVSPSKASDAAEMVKDAAADATDAGREFAEQLATQFAQYAGRIEQFAKTLPPAVTKSLKDQPLTTLAIASLAAFALGAIIKK